MSKVFTIRSLEEKDNAALATIIRSSLKEFGADKPGTVYFDPTTDDLHRLFQHSGSGYFVALNAQELAGGAGYFPTAELPADTCELVKMYVAKDFRNHGLGRMLLEHAMDQAKKAGYKFMYLESMPELMKAISLYEKYGFEKIDHPLGNSGHDGCDLWMIKAL